MVALGAKVIGGRILDSARTWRKDIVELVNIGMATVTGDDGVAPPSLPKAAKRTPGCFRPLSGWGGGELPASQRLPFSSFILLSSTLPGRDNDLNVFIILFSNFMRVNRKMNLEIDHHRAHANRDEGENQSAC